jgi:hypothetical protein
MRRDFLHDLGNQALSVAAKGQVSDMNAIRSTMTDIGAVGRQAALLGEDALAEESRKKMVDALVSFSKTFVEQSCWDQSFDDELPYSIQRQNEMLGTGIDVIPCAQRRFNAQSGILTFESCTVRRVGDWRVLWNMAAPGTTGGRGSGAEPDLVQGGCASERQAVQVTGRIAGINGSHGGGIGGRHRQIGLG